MGIKKPIKNIIIGKKIYYFEEIDSTNDEAKRLVRSGAGEGVVVIAEKQSKGRGKPGRVWASPAGGIYLSAILKPRKNPKDLSTITFLGAISVARAIKALFHINANLKWPNDILLSGKKVGGVLTEISKGAVIIGIGLNVNTELSSFPKELRKDVTSIKKESGRKVDISKFLKVLIKELDSWYNVFLSKGAQEVVSEWELLSLEN
ncbi:MAG: biotin--[acetyl-CoA-carboxylase] ligase [Candidatus Saganbacteria bacterium]|nr:biotin--[acetyl-CoA-carboxylase] ligase [Candidatus Saganbacteria bacterium]